MISWGVVAVLVFAASPTAPQVDGGSVQSPEPGSWSTAATPLTYFEKMPLDEHPTGQIVESPDHLSSVRLGRELDRDEAMYELEVSQPGAPRKKLTCASHPEVLWSPDSKAFFTTSTEGGMVGTWMLRVHLPESKRIKTFDPTREVRADFARRLPTCDSPTCTAKDLATFRSYVNTAGVAWTGPDSLIVYAGWPCSSSGGSNMCSYMLYEVAARSGKILRTVGRAEFESRYLAQCPSCDPENFTDPK